MMEHNRSLLISIVLLLMLSLGLVACQTDEEPPAPTAVATAESSPIDDVNTRSVNTGVGTVTAEGEVKPLRTADLSFQTGGKIAEILAVSGANVSAGDPLATLDAVPLQNALRQAEAGRTAAEASLQAAQARLMVAESGVARAQAAANAAAAQLELVRAGATPEEIAAAEQRLAAAEAAIVQAAGNRDASVRVSDAEVQSAQAQLAAAQAEVDQLQEQYDDIFDACFKTPDGEEVCPLFGPVEENTRGQLEAAQKNLESARLAVEEARSGATPAESFYANTGVGLAMAQRDQAQAELNLTLAETRPEEIDQAQVGVDQAQVGVEQAQVAVTQAQAAVTQAEAGVVQAEADVEAARKALDRMTLFAPFDGRVGDISVEVGELVGSGAPVMRFGDFGGWVVETTDLTELDVVAVKVGLPAEVRIDALPGEVINGTVTDIAAVSELIRGDVTYPVTIALEDTDLPLRWGMTATVDIETAE